MFDAFEDEELRLTSISYSRYITTLYSAIDKAVAIGGEAYRNTLEEELHKVELLHGASIYEIDRREALRYRATMRDE